MHWKGKTFRFLRRKVVGNLSFIDQNSDHIIESQMLLCSCSKYGISSLYRNIVSVVDLKWFFSDPDPNLSLISGPDPDPNSDRSGI
jgi:hypothetical protein